MRVGLSLLGACLLYSGVSYGAVPDWIIPSPVSIALTVGKWMSVERADDTVYYVQVQSSGATETEAREQAFRFAVDQAVGSLTLSEITVDKKDLSSHTTVNYSSGYIHDFKYVKKHHSDKVYLVVDVWVKKSKIANRLRSNSQDQNDLQGGKIAEIFKNLQQQHEAGDQLLGTVLNDFPQKAVGIAITNIQYTYTNRIPTLHLTINTWWHKSYTDALKEAVEVVGIKSTWFDNTRASANRGKHGVLFTRTACFLCDDYLYTIDKTKSDFIWNVMNKKQPYVLANFVDSHNQTIHQECWQWENMQGMYSSTGKTLYSNSYPTQIFPDVVLSNTVTRTLDKVNISRLDKIDVSIVTKDQCNL